MQHCNQKAATIHLVFTLRSFASLASRLFMGLTPIFVSVNVAKATVLCC